MYTIYHIPGIKVGCSIEPDKRVRAQGYDSYEVLEVISTIEEASEREIYWQIKLGYGRDCTITYQHMMKVCAIAHTPEVYKKIKETRKTSKAWNNKTYKLTEQGLQARMKVLNNPDTIKKRLTNRKKCILQYDKQGNFIKEWQSAADVQKTLNISALDLGACARGEQKTAYGFVWKYKNN